MENAEEIFHFLEDFSKRKPKTIPQELNEYLAYVARTGDPIYQWPLVKSLFKEKLLSVITDFYETTPGIEIPPYPNVDTFNYDIMKNSLLERLDSFTSAPFTVQRICELLTFPRKQYNRIDKYMRAIEKNILVVSTREPGAQRHPEENGEVNEPIVNGSDNNSEYNVDVEMEDVSWKENNVQPAQIEPKPSSSDTHISVDDIEARLKAKEDLQMDTQEKTATQYESVTPPEPNVPNDSSDKVSESQPQTSSEPQNITSIATTEPIEKPEEPKIILSTEESKVDVEMKTETPITTTLVIPEIRVDDAEMTEQKLLEQAKTEKQKIEKTEAKESEPSNSESETKSALETETPQAIDESSSDSKDEPETKLSEVLTSSEESSSSSDNTDGSSNSPKTDEGHIDIQEESNPTESNTEPIAETKIVEKIEQEQVTKIKSPPPKIESDNYSISDVNSELKEPLLDCKKVEETVEKIEEVKPSEETKSIKENKAEKIEETSVEKETETQN